jgi:hypothetical protein
MLTCKNTVPGRVVLCWAARCCIRREAELKGEYPAALSQLLAFFHPLLTCDNQKWYVKPVDSLSSGVFA